MKTFQAHEAEAIVRPDGTVRVEGVPFSTGDRVRVMILSLPPDLPRLHSPEEIERSRLIREGLHGSVLRYDDPFSPAVPIEDWEALK